MVRPEKINNAFLKQSREHKIILDYVVRYDKLLAEQNLTELSALIRSMAPMLEKDLLTHFEMEEKVFFPAALLSHPTKETVTLILSLQKEHGLLESRMAELTRLIRLRKEKHADVEKHINALFKPFISQLKTHTRIEIQDLFPLLDKDEACKEQVVEFINQL